MRQDVLGISVTVLSVAILVVGCGGIASPAQPTPTLVPLPALIPTTPAPLPTQAQMVTTPPLTLTPTVAQPPPAPTLLPTPTSSPIPSEPEQPTAIPTPLEVVVEVDRLNVRSGPSTAYPRVGQLEKGSGVEIVGRDQGGTWWQITYEVGEGGRAWIAAAYVTASADPIEVPVVSPPLPPPTPALRFVGKIVFQESSGGRIFIVNADGTDLTHLTNGLDPDWSPDGKSIVFTRWEWDPPGVFVINADGSAEEQIVGGPKAKGPRWSPDGSRIAFTSEREESGGTVCFGPWGCFILPKEKHWKLNVLDLATDHVMDPASDPFSFAPSWSPDSTRLVYDGVRGLRPADPIQGHDQKAAFIDYDHRDTYPVWSPTSDRIAFVFRQHDHWEIYAINADGTGRTRLTNSPLFESPQNSVAPEWSPDGRWIAFLTDRRGEWEVWVMQPDGNQQQPLFPPDTLEGINFFFDAQSEHVLDWWMP